MEEILKRIDAIELNIEKLLDAVKGLNNVIQQLPIHESWEDSHELSGAIHYTDFYIHDIELQTNHKCSCLENIPNSPTFSYKDIYNVQNRTVRNFAHARFSVLSDCPQCNGTGWVKKSTNKEN